MIAKFLFGTERVIPTGSEDSPTNVQYKDLLFIVRKHDVYQHADMAKLYRIHPSTGGFVKGLGKPGEENFYGESVSCRVQTDDSMLELYYPLTKEGDWYKHTYTNSNGSKFTTFCGVPAGYIPSSLLSNVEWEPIQYAEVKATMRKEIEENSSPFNW